MKKYISILLSGMLLTTSFTGCTNNVKPHVNITKYQKDIKQESDNTKSIDNVYISGFVKKKSNFNHEIKNNSYLVYKLPKNPLLGNLNSINGIPVTVNGYVKNIQINISSNYIKGRVTDILDKIAYVTNTYWTINNGIISFVGVKEIVYTFPAMTLTKIYEVYNTGEKSSESLNTDFIFKDLKSVLDGLIQTKQFSGEVAYDTTSSFELNNNKAIANSKKNNNTKAALYSNNNKTNNGIVNKNVNLNKNTNQRKLKINPDLISQSNNYKTANINNKKIKRVSRRRSSNSNPVNNLLNNSNNNKIILSNESNSKNLKSIEKNKKNENKITNNKEFSNTNIKKDNSVVNKKSNYNIKYNSNSTRIILSPSSGTVIAYVTPDEEKKLDIILNEVMKKMLSNLVRLNIYVISSSYDKLKNFNINAGINTLSGSTTKSFSLASGGLGYIVSQGTVSDPFVRLNMAVNYLSSNSNENILLNSSILSLPNIVSKIKDTTNIPFLEPQQISNGNGTDLSYKINYIQQGINMAVLSTVFSNNIVMAIKMNVIQYMGEKSLKAGILGDFSLPIASPKTIQTTLRAKAGDLIIFGGIKRKKNANSNESQFELVPTGLKKEKSKSEYVFVIMPTLVKFNVIKNETKLSLLNKFKKYNNINEVPLTESEWNEYKKDKKSKQVLHTISEWDNIKNSIKKQQIKTIYPQVDIAVEENIKTGK